MKKTRKILIVLIILALIYSICLFIGGLVIEKIGKLEQDLISTIESTIREEQRNFLQSVVDKLEYDIDKNNIDINDTKAISDWCKHNYSFIRTNELNESFVIEIMSDKIVDSSIITSNRTGDYLSSDLLSKYNFSKEDNKTLISELKKYKDTTSQYNFTIKDLWLEWKTFPDNILYDDHYLDETGKEKGSNKYIFISTVDSNNILKEYDSTFNSIKSVKLFIFATFTISLLSVIIVICNITYREIFKEK